ncbi:hypothetical protein AN216_08015 [Streptomyces oceani]|uniref:Sugar phosphate isomerase n=1 Tax=Streptomyces oceani TaxID=1075402 RepID=A0A1E7KKM2_9ACTN|nr:hypothetical protein AN216_08015 [Streptomyces oceani]
MLDEAYRWLCRRTDAAGRDWLDEALAEVRRAGPEPAATDGPAPLPAWEAHFAAAGRRCRRTKPEAVGPQAPGDSDIPDTPDNAGAPDDPATVARVLLLHAAGVRTGTLTRLYTRGTGAERRAVLRALPHLTAGPEALHLVTDALRTNDTRLIAAALGPYAATHLDPPAWRQAVLKCLFTGIPVAAISALSRRAAGDRELARMLADYAAERTAAGRDVPTDLCHVLTLTGKES